ncbi:MAG: enoyl-CoA hydratase/isomerase family protein [Bacteroidia bacterium]|nr:enoyl-CoA hydratase/isomerase family protein [Bacteroidia bacterium]
MSTENTGISREDFVRIEKKDGVATLWLDRKGEKMNVVNPGLINMMAGVFEELENDNEVKAVVLISGKKDFIAGADINAFKAEKEGDFQPISRKGHEILARIAASKKPVVAAIHGTAYGLGVELPLACHARICSDHKSTKLALPEVKLGLLPGGGGTQRLPKLVGLQASLDMMLTGKNIFAFPAKRMGLVDDVVNKNKLHQSAVALAKRIAEGKWTRPKRKKKFVQWFLDDTGIGRNIVFSQARKTVARMTQGNYPAVPEIINCVEIGLKKGNKAGYEAEVIKFEKLMLGQVSKELINIFHVMTDKKKNPWAEVSKKTNTIALLGAGFMGAGIAEVSIFNDMDIFMKDISQDMITDARKLIWKSISTKMKRRIYSKADAQEVMGRVRGQLDYADFDKVDIVIEAVPEKMDLKKAIIKEVEGVARPDTIFATNTSALSITEMSKAAARPENVIGMHYFSPVPKMPLLEIIRTDKTADWVIGTCYEAGVRQGKTVIVVKDGPGFYANRILAPYLNEAMLMLEEGAEVADVDRAMTKAGYPVGPFKVMDEVGLDVGAHVMTGDMIDVVKEREGVKVATGLLDMFKAGYLGRKNKKGYYLYHPKTGKRLKGNPDVYQYFGGKPRTKFDPTEIQQRCLMQMLNEAVMCLEEGIIAAPVDGDVGAVFGLGFPPFTGGPFRYIDAVGAKAVVDIMEGLMGKFGPKFRPAKMLKEKAEKGERFHG